MRVPIPIKDHLQGLHCATMTPECTYIGESEVEILLREGNEKVILLSLSLGGRYCV